MARHVTLDVLDQIQIASPCPVRWEDMAGDDHRRHCSRCNLHVYNLSAMSRRQAVELVTRAEGRLCAGFWRRADGTILTQDCPVGMRVKATAAARRVAAAIALVLGAGLMIGATRGPAWRLRQVQPFATVCDWLRPPPPLARSIPRPPGQMVLGAVARPVAEPTASWPKPERANGGKR